MTFASSRLRSPRAAGFSLVESLVVVVMVSILVVLAIPTISWQMRSRRVSQAAGQVTQVFTRARALAMGRGSAVLVAFSPGLTGQGRFDVREAVASMESTGYCALSGYSSCTTTDWGIAVNPTSVTKTATPTYRPYESLGFDPTRIAAFGTTTITGALIPPGGSAYGAPSSGSLDVCFSPMGRTYVRSPGVVTAAGTVNANPGTWVQSLQVLQFFVAGDANALSNGAGTGSFGFTRSVIVPPNGNARQGA